MKTYTIHSDGAAEVIQVQGGVITNVLGQALRGRPGFMAAVQAMEGVIDALGLRHAVVWVEDEDEAGEWDVLEIGMEVRVFEREGRTVFQRLD